MVCSTKEESKLLPNNAKSRICSPGSGLLKLTTALAGFPPAFVWKCSNPWGKIMTSHIHRISRRNESGSNFSMQHVKNFGCSRVCVHWNNTTRRQVEPSNRQSEAIQAWKLSNKSGSHYGFDDICVSFNWKYNLI